MYIKVENKDKITRGEGEQYSIDNYLVNDGDIIFIQKDTLYSVEGVFDAVLINTPAFDIKNEKTE